AAALDMDDGAVDPKARPGRGRDRVEVEAEILVDWNPLTARPIQVRVDHVFAGRRDIGHALTPRIRVGSSPAFRRFRSGGLRPQGRLLFLPPPSNDRANSPT